MGWQRLARANGRCGWRCATGPATAGRSSTSACCAMTPPRLTCGPAQRPAGQRRLVHRPVQVALSIEDAGSGPDLLRYRLNGAPWQQTTSTATLQITRLGRHVLDYYGQDRAGFLAGPHHGRGAHRPRPAGRAHRRRHHADDVEQRQPVDVSWRNPWMPRAWPWPAGAGSRRPARRTARRCRPLHRRSPWTPPAEGVHDLYLWLEDVAGNVSLDQMATLPDAIRYDATPPTLTVADPAGPQPSRLVPQPGVGHRGRAGQPVGRGQRSPGSWTTSRRPPASLSWSARTASARCWCAAWTGQATSARDAPAAHRYAGAAG